MGAGAAATGVNAHKGPTLGKAPSSRRLREFVTEGRTEEGALVWLVS